MEVAARPSWWSRITERHLLAGLLVFFVLVSVQYGFKASSGDGSRSALLRWRQQLLSMQDGENIYEQNAYPNPPIMALMLAPIATWTDPLGLPPMYAGLLWFYLKVGMILLSLRWVFRMVETPEQRLPLWAKALTVLLSLRAFTGDLQHGNINLFILFLVVGGVYALHQGRDVLGGLVLALAMACKVTPALFVPYLIWKRAWKALAGVGAGLLLFFWPGFVPAVFLGWEDNLKSVQSWMKNMAKPFVVEGFVTSEHHNQSLPGLVYRTLTESPSFIGYVDNKPVPESFHNFLSLSRETARLIVKGCMLLFVGFVAWTCRARRGDPSARSALTGEYAIVVLGMLLFSERTWKHHCVTLLLPFAVLCAELARRKGSLAWRSGLSLALAVAVLLMTTTSISLFGREFGKLAQVYGAYVGAFVVLLAALAAVLRWPLRDSVARQMEFPQTRSLSKAG